MVRVIAGVTAVVAAFVVAAPASAQSGFTDYRQAAADQYPTQPPPAQNPPQGGTQGESATGGSGGSQRPASGHGKGNGNGNKHGGQGGQKPAVAGAEAPVAVPTHAVDTSGGSLPFTGSDLSGLVVLALLLLAAGFLIRAVERATRRRRAPA